LVIIQIRKSRDFVKKRLLESLDFLDDVICDETNNPPDVVDDEVIIAQCIWDKSSDGSFKYIYLAFGNPERTFKYLLTYR
jgi:hypothetical protein